MDEIIKTLGVKEDRRVRKTKKSLRDSLFALLGEKNIDQITVTELTRRADLNRSTFYLYYNDVYDMMDKIQTEIYQVMTETVINCVSSFSVPEDFEKYCAAFLTFCKENYTLCCFVTRNDCKNQLADKIKADIRNVIPDSAVAFEKTDPRYYLTSFALSAIISVTMEWMNDGMNIPPEEMARFLSHTYLFGSKAQKETGGYQQHLSS
ncbi:MAG: TetR/AcrR family transcriptional regulator [Oscillospiraceae bacterium]|nr:TetR/AcrR family transcriptional regulator [Oscillospiraceae bacterium]MDD6146031.1 TetR/AcrR family transcriptional regulator [Oscillospiraceae bacterium]